MLHTAMMNLTGLSVRPDNNPAQSTQGLLLDSYVLYRSSRLSVIHSVVERDREGGGSRYVACAALSSLNDASTSIVALNLSHEDSDQQCTMRTKVQFFLCVYMYVPHIVCSIFSWVPYCFE